MLVVCFSIGVEKDHAEELANKLNDLGIIVCNYSEFEETGLQNDELVSRVYFDCYAPRARLAFLIDYLENEFKETAILSY